MKRARILISAFALSPVRGSEAGIGWEICSRLGRYHDVTVLYGKNHLDNEYQKETEGYLSRHGAIDGVTFYPIASPPWSRICHTLHNLGIWIVYYSGYAAWQRAALKGAVRLHGQGPFALAHQLTMTGFREPGYLWRMGIPFVWGPIGGAVMTPWAFFPILSWRGRLFYGTRNIVNFIHKRTKVRARLAARRARQVWVAGEADQRMVADLWGVPAEILWETGTSPNENARVHGYDASRPLRISWSAEHTGRKALPILLKALASLGNRVPFALSVLGQGPETLRWQKLTRRLGLGDRVTWLGWIAKQEAMRVVSETDVFALTSIQDATSSIVMEALSMGVLVICHDASGMGEVVTDECGIKIEMRNPTTSILGFSRAIERLYTNPTLIERLSAGALRRAEELTWDAKVERIAECYDRILRHR